MILIWDNLLKRGYVGPGRCALCKISMEGTCHLFLQCPFSYAIWEAVLSFLRTFSRWEGSTVECCLKIWFKEQKAYKALPLYLFWGIWRVRNALIFEHTDYMWETCIRISSFFLERGHVTMVQNTEHIILRDVWDSFPVGFFWWGYISMDIWKWNGDIFELWWILFFQMARWLGHICHGGVVGSMGHPLLYHMDGDWRDQYFGDSKVIID